MIYRLAFFAALVLALAGCDRAKTNQAQTRPNKPASFRDSIFASVTPTADGGAYAIGDSGLGYLRGSQAVKVRFSNLPTGKTRRSSPRSRSLLCLMAVRTLIL
jgi:hypothetical protein